MSKERILWVSDLGVTTGFARVSHSIIKNIKDKYNIDGFGINYKGMPHKIGIDIYPASANSMRDPMGFSRIGEMALSGRYDMIFILQDVWVISKYLEEIKARAAKLNVEIPKIVLYFPVDAEEHLPEWYKDFDIVSQAVVYNKFGRVVASKASPDVNFKIIPHGVDTTIFRKTFANRKEAKKIIYGDSGFNKDFLVLNVNRNQPRKRLDITLRGFKLFSDGKDDVGLYMHCGVVDASIDVAKLAMRIGLLHDDGKDNKMILTNLNAGPQNVPDEALNLYYNAADVGINTSLGEGWGLGAVEHAATGAYQIVPNSSACKELFDGIGTLIPIVADYTFDGIMTVGKLVSPEGVAAALEDSYQKFKAGKLNGDLGMKKFTSDKYSWKTISETWSELFNEVMK